ncbi:MAG: formate dehydrogenase accessory sulfurtransferase FdhD, partial [Clostridiales bacterium]|nr:formate dehydrogenase accessory sulfurtransferase FdhD [Clostridiales bacterium]
MIGGASDIQSLEIAGETVRAALSPASPASPPLPEKRFSARQILRLPPLFLCLSSVFEKTGGVHSCALSDGEEILFFAEDVGRHNAADKIIGHCLLQGIEMRDKLLLTSGRAPFEIIAKVLRAGFALLVSRSAPTDKAIEAAREGGLPLAAFARNGRFNVYSHAEKIDLED